jgi:hypothetical protein
MAATKRPPVGINPNIPIEVQRELRKIAGFAFDAGDNASAALEGLQGKVGKTASDLLEVSRFVSEQVQAGGQYPISLTSLVGRAGQNQLAYVPEVVNLPTRASPLSADGQGVWFKGQLWRFSSKGGGASSSAVQPGVWQSNLGHVLVGTHAERLASYPASDYDSVLFWETDRTTLYLSILSTWVYVAGVMRATLAAAPADLTATGDIGFLFYVTTGTAAVEYYHLLRWTGTGWEPAPCDVMGGYFQDYIKVPTDHGWVLSNGGATKYLEITAGVLSEVAITLPDMTNGVQRVSGSSYSGSVSNPADTGITIALPTIHNLVPFSEAFDQWWKESKPGTPPFPPITVTPDAALNPAGTAMTADQVDFLIYGIPALDVYYIARGFNVTRGDTVTFSVWLKTTAPGLTFKLQIGIFEPAAGGWWTDYAASGELTVNDTWAQYSVSWPTPLTGYTDHYFVVFIGAVIGPPEYEIPASGSVYAWGALVNAGGSVGTYIETGSKPEIGEWTPGVPPSEGTVPVAETPPMVTTLPYFRC